MEALLDNVAITYYARRTYSANWRVESERFPIYGVLLILEGSVHYVINGREYDLTSGDMICFNPGCTRFGTASTSLTYLSIDFILPETSVLRLPEHLRVVYTKELDSLINDFEYQWLQKPAGYGEKGVSLFKQIMCLLIGNENITQYDSRVEKIKQYINEHYAQSICVKGMAEMVELSTVYCGALFRKIQGITISEYANLVRIRHAHSLLEDEKYTISEVAELCGFCDLYYFSSTFKRITGVSPRAFRSKNLRFNIFI